jgi:hypothetical protein
MGGERAHRNALLPIRWRLVCFFSSRIILNRIVGHSFAPRCGSRDGVTRDTLGSPHFLPVTAPCLRLAGTLHAASRYWEKWVHFCRSFVPANTAIAMASSDANSPVVWWRDANGAPSRGR